MLARRWVRAKRMKPGRVSQGQSALLSQPSRRHYYAATQISMAVALINAGANFPALHFLDLAIANAGGGVPYAAENVQPPQPVSTALGVSTLVSESEVRHTRDALHLGPLFLFGVAFDPFRSRQNAANFGAGHSLE